MIFAKHPSFVEFIVWICMEIHWNCRKNTHTRARAHTHIHTHTHT